MPRAIFRLPSAQRYVEAARYTGLRCEVVYDPNRDGVSSVRRPIGKVICVAFGSPSDVLVLQADGHEPEAFSLATVREINIL